MVAQQAAKRVGAASSSSAARATWDHRKLGGVLLARIAWTAQGPDPLRAARARACARSRTRAPSSSCRSPTSRCCSTGSRRWPQAGIEEIGIIIAPETGDEIRDGRRRRLAVRRARSPTSCRTSRSGLAHAVLTAEPFLGDDAVRHVPRRQPAAGRHRRPRRAPSATHEPDALILLTPVPDPENYGVAELDGDARRAPASRSRRSRATDLALVGVYMFTPAIHDAARAIEPSARGELEITDAIQHLVDTRPARRAAHRAGLVEGHRPPRRHARGQPADPRHVERARRRRADRLAGRRARGRRGGRAARALDRPRARRSSAPARG